MKADVAGLISFIVKAEKLKATMRHSWLSDSDRQESVAEHSWMLGLMAMAIFDSLGIEVDQLKVLKMVIIHDLAEAVTGDIPSFEISKRKEQKFENEKKALGEIMADLPAELSDEFMKLWLEMEANETNEARLAQCLDKSEVIIQHAVADIKTWDDNDYKIGTYNKDEYFDFNPYIREFKNAVNKLFWDKLESEGTVYKAHPEHIKKYQSGKI